VWQLQLKDPAVYEALKDSKSNVLETPKGFWQREEHKERSDPVVSAMMNLFVENK
jgi:hypothetical protein